MERTVFAFDCGATNWRLYRAGYQVDKGVAVMIGEPQPAPLTSFDHRSLPAVIQLTPDGSGLQSIGDVAQQCLEDEELRELLRDHFKPSIGVHLERNPLPHQKRYTHEEALRFTGMLVAAVLDQLCREKWNAPAFDDRVCFSFAYPVHWRDQHRGVVLDDFKRTVLSCIPQELHHQVHFVAEPEGAILSLSRQGLLRTAGTGKAILIVDVGGSSTDLVAGISNKTDNQVTFIGRYGEAHGGGLYDAELAKFLADELHIPASVLADDPSALYSLRNYGRQLKESLSRQMLRPTQSISDSQWLAQRAVTLVLHGGQVFRRTIRLEETNFRDVARHLIADFQHLIEAALQVMKLQDSDIGQVVLVGGGAQLFSVVKHLRERFGEKAVLLADNPDEVVVQGVALEYGKSFEIERLSRGLVGASAQALAGMMEVPPGWQMLSNQGETIGLNQVMMGLGRKSSNAIWVKDDQASRFHAELHFTPLGWTVVDLGSTNGTFINGARLNPQQPCPMRAGDELRIGQIIYKLRLLDIPTNHRR